jgi:hypothetical protein
MAEKKEEFNKDLELKKNQRLSEMEERENKLKLMNEEKKERQQEQSAIKLEQTKRKLAESSLKREVALKSQMDTIEKKIEHNKIKAAEKKE